MKYSSEMFCSCGDYESRVVTDNNKGRQYVCKNCGCWPTMAKGYLHGDVIARWSIIEVGHSRYGTINSRYGIINALSKANEVYKEECKINKEKEQVDKGSHYRYTYRVKLTEDDIKQGYKDIKLDPYRVCSIYEMTGGPLEHIVKKSLRGGKKGHSSIELFKEIICCAQRGLDMLEEDDINE